MKIIFTLLCVLFSSFLFGQSYSYKIKINVESNPESIKQAQSIVAKIFDVAPETNPETFEMQIKSNVFVEKETLEQKLFNYGFTLESFSKSEQLPLPDPSEH